MELNVDVAVVKWSKEGFLKSEGKLSQDVDGCDRLTACGCSELRELAEF